MKGICCNCGKEELLNHRLICGRCIKLKLPKKIKFPSVINKTTKCVICNYPFPNDKKILEKLYWCGDRCCGCCQEKYSRLCKKDLMFGRKGISIKISKKTKQGNIIKIIEEDMFL